MDIEIEKIKDNELEEFLSFASDIWQEYFTFLLSNEQIDYMVDMFFAPEHIKHQVQNENYEYYFCKIRGEKIGFIGLQIQQDSIFLSKLYLKKSSRGKGFASEMMQFVFDRAKSTGKQRLWLTCNKHNEHSLDVYKAKGWKIIDEQVADIGRGYVMDDYILEYKIVPKN